MIVYQNRGQYHLSSHEVEFEVWESMAYGHVISDACAQTIASWWHSPRSPNSTAPSTMGAVTDDMTLSDFATQHEYSSCTKQMADALDALVKYIETKQRTSK
jgi:hypothetical protein